VRIAARAACDMLPIAMVTLDVTNEEDFDIFIWIRDLNTVGRVFTVDGARLNQDSQLSVQLQEDGNGKVSYHWAAEQIVDEKPAYHWVGLVKPSDPAAVVTADEVPTLDFSDTKKAGGVPYMFRPYP